ncbi:MAG: Hsp33 family molecular chaperone HslO [Deltaproteobacteria bacterium]|nr:Hsp33 family molecular chaperone HslO [Deltaproteobacteria bacterium]
MSFEDHLLRAFIAEGAARVLAVDVREVARTTRSSHFLGAGAARLAAEGAVATALFSAYLKGEAKVSLQIQLEHPKAAYMGDVSGEGQMRARFTPAHVPLPEDGALRGALMVIQWSGDKEVYRGTSAIDDTSLQGALAHHLRTSSQVDVALRIAVEQDEDGDITRAIGVLVERLPTHDELPSLEPEDFYRTFGAVESLSASALEAALDARELAGSELSVLDQKPVTWHCGCSQERVEGMLLSLGSDELQSMHDEDGGASVTCHFCNTPYAVSAPRLLELIGALRRSPEVGASPVAEA